MCLVYKVVVGVLSVPDHNGCLLLYCGLGRFRGEAARDWTQSLAIFYVATSIGAGCHCFNPTMSFRWSYISKYLLHF